MLGYQIVVLKKNLRSRLNDRGMIPLDLPANLPYTSDNSNDRLVRVIFIFSEFLQNSSKKRQPSKIM